MAAGIYALLHHGTRVYIGCSGDLGRRWRVHRHYLRHGRHPARGLQEVWTRDGEEAFGFEVLESMEGCSRAVALERERAWIRACTPAYNDRGRTRRRVITRHYACTQKGARSMAATSGGAERVSLNARVDPALREQARACAEQRGIPLNDLIIAAVTTYCSPPLPDVYAAPSLPLPDAAPASLPAPATVPHDPAPPLGVDASELPLVDLAVFDELLRLTELVAADMHLVREVLHTTHPAEEAQARHVTRAWLDKLGIGRWRREQTC